MNLFKGDPRGYSVYIDLPDGSYNSFGGPRTPTALAEPCTDARSIKSRVKSIILEKNRAKRAASF